MTKKLLVGVYIYMNRIYYVVKIIIIYHIRYWKLKILRLYKKLCKLRLEKKNNLLEKGYMWTY